MVGKKLQPIGNINSLYYETRIDNREKHQRGVLKRPKSLKSKKVKIIERRLINPTGIDFSDFLVKKEIERDQSKKLESNEEILNRKLLEIRSDYEDELRKHGEQTSIMEGFVYMLSNPSFPGWVKAGMSFDYEKRLSVYNQNDPESRYSFISLRWTPNRRITESNLLKELETESIYRKGEWFKINEIDALRIFYSVME